MKRFWCALCSVAFLIPAFTFGQAARRYDLKIAPDKQIVHVLSRLTFGARPGDAAEVRKLGVDKWIDQQLHPERLAENPALESRLAVLETVKLQTSQILQEYTPQPQQMFNVRPRLAPASVLSPLQVSKLMNGGSAEERLAVWMSLKPEIRTQLLLSAPPQATEGLPDLQQEAAKARQAEQEKQQAERRKLMPPINELLTQDQMRITRTGTDQEKIAILDSLDAAARRVPFPPSSTHQFQPETQSRAEGRRRSRTVDDSRRAPSVPRSADRRRVRRARTHRSRRVRARLVATMRFLFGTVRAQVLVRLRGRQRIPEWPRP